MKNVIILAFLALTACAGQEQGFQPVALPPIGNSPIDDSTVRALAFVTIQSSQQTAFHKILNTLSLLPTAFASTGTTTVTYSLAPSVTFSINVAGLTGGTFTGNTLNMGSISIATLSDNNLKICNPGGNTKCTQAIMRVYTTGAVAGFVNISDSPQYGAPVYVGTLNPSTAITLNSPGVAVQQVTGMAASKHTVVLSDFPTPTYAVTSDFSNAGTGSYSMGFVLEYALAP